MLGDVGDFMRHHRCQLRFVLGEHDQAAVHADHAARHGPGIDGAVVDGEEAEVHPVVVAGGHQLIAQALQVVGDLHVRQHCTGAAQFAGGQVRDAAFLMRWQVGQCRIAKVRQLIGRNPATCQRQQAGQVDSASVHAGYDKQARPSVPCPAR